MHGNEDEIVSHKQSELFYKDLKDAGLDVEFHLIPGAGHGFGKKADLKSFSEEMMFKFFEAKLKNLKVKKS